jgi:hypothetical protein
VRYEDQVLIRDFCIIVLQIARAKNPTAKFDIDEKTVRKSEGFNKLRLFFISLSPRKREKYRHFLRTQVQGVRSIIAKAKASGEAFDLSDIEIDVFDSESGERVPDAPTVQLEQAEPSDECEHMKGVPGSCARCEGT